MLGRNSWMRPVPLVPRYVALTVSDAGRSRWIETCQLCAEPIRKSGSTAKVFSVSPAGATNPLASVSGFVARVGDAQRVRERRLLRHERGDRLIDVRVAVDSVSRAHDDRRSGHRSPRDGKTRLQPAPIRPHQRRGKRFTRQRPGRVCCHDGADRLEARSDIQVHETSEALGERRLVFPARASGDRERRARLASRR